MFCRGDCGRANSPQYSDSAQAAGFALACDANLRRSSESGTREGHSITFIRKQAVTKSSTAVASQRPTMRQYYETIKFVVEAA